MERVFLKIFGMSFASGCFILAVIVIRALFRRMPRRWVCVLWGLVGIRLLLPVTIISRFSLIPDRGISWYKVGTIQAYAAAYNYPRIASMVWLSGLTVAICVIATQYMIIRKRVSEAAHLKDNVWLCDNVRTPFVIGILRPRIYLPSDMDEKDISSVLVHERMHIKRGDHLWKLIGCLILAVHWFDPIVWAGYFIFARDIELACDESVISGYNDEEKKAYADALLACSMRRRKVFCYLVGFGEIAAIDRVRAIRDFIPSRPFVCIASALICVIAAFCFMTNPPKRPGYVRLQTALMPSEPVKVVTFNVKGDDNKMHRVNVTARQQGPDVGLYFDSDFDDSAAEYIVTFSENPKE